MFRPLSQRIRESVPVRLVLDNRLARAIRDRPVTSAPSTRDTVLVGLVPALVTVASLAGYFWIVAYHPGTYGLLGWLSIATLLLGGLVIGGGRLRSVLGTIIATGLFFVFVAGGAVQVVSDYVLELRGSEVNAVVGPDVVDPTGCASVSAWRYRSYTPAHARLVFQRDGTQLPGAIGIADNTYRTRHLYRTGERVVVLVDPANGVCTRAKSDVHTVVDTVTTGLATGCVAWVFLLTPLDWRLRRRAKYERWRAQAR